MDFNYRGVFVSDASEIVTFFGPDQPRDRYYCEIDGTGYWTVTQKQMREVISEALA
jgi:hypothetical protein